MKLVKKSYRNRSYFDRINLGMGINVENPDEPLDLPEYLTLCGFQIRCMVMDSRLIYLFLEDKKINGFRLLKDQIYHQYEGFEEDLAAEDPLLENNFIQDRVWKNREIGTWTKMKYHQIPNLIVGILNKILPVGISEFQQRYPTKRFSWVGYYTISQLEVAIDIPVRAGLDFATSESFQTAFSKDGSQVGYGYHPSVITPRGEQALNLSTAERLAIVRAAAGKTSSSVGNDPRSKRFCYKMFFHDRVYLIAYVKHIPELQKGKKVSKYWLGRFEKRYSSEEKSKSSGATKIKNRFGTNRFENAKEFSGLIREICDEHFDFIYGRLSNSAIHLTEKERFNAVASAISSICTHRSHDVIRLLVTGNQTVTPRDIASLKLRRDQLVKAYNLGLLDRSGPKDSVFSINWSDLGCGYLQEQAKSFYEK